MEELNCKSVQGSLWDFTADAIEEPLLRAMELHLRKCRECEMRKREARSMRSGLRNLPQPPMPSLLATRLRISASRERSRLLARRDFHSWLQEQKSRAWLFFDNLLKPFAVPAAGGILASFLCFGVIIDTLHVSPHWDDDIPLGMSTEVKIDELSPFCFGAHDVMVQLTVDATGNVTDYNVPSANPSPEEMQEIGNLVLYSSFTPATRFGQAVSSKRLFYIRHISIKG